jgi:hypothetical protein
MSMAGLPWPRSRSPWHRWASMAILLLLTMLAVARVVTPRLRSLSAQATSQPATTETLPTTDAVADRVMPAQSVTESPALAGYAWKLSGGLTGAGHVATTPQPPLLASADAGLDRDAIPYALTARPGCNAAGDRTPLRMLLRDDSNEAALSPDCDVVATTAASDAVQPASATALIVSLPTAAATAPVIQSAHPRLLLDSTTLTRLRAAAAANTQEWQQLKATCDSYIGGAVNYPTGNQYPDLPDLGSGYQGEVYLPALLAEGMCYQVLKSSNPSAAAPYGAKGVDILMKMSTPYSTASGNQGWDPCYDDGYGIRNYGVGFGLGYDWLYDLLSTSQRTQVYTTANAWITAWETSGGCADFAFKHPLSNYYAGYFHAKAAIAMATNGDNPSAPAEWDDWYNNQFAQRVQPYFAKHLTGGGWLEGYANYAPLAIFNMSLPIREVKTATGVDLVHASAPFAYPLDSATYAMHFTWPSRAYFDDRDTNHANGIASPPVGTTQFGMFQQMLGALDYWSSPNVAVFHQYLNDVNTATNGYNPAAAWLVFLDADPGMSTQSVSTLPLSYLATGIGAVAARSDWGTAASWMSFRAGPYIENPDQAEEGFDQGSLALARGNTPLLVNTYGWMVHEPNGSSDETLLYNDLFADFNGTPYQGNRQIYNVYYTRRMNGTQILDAFGQGSYTQEDNQVSTKVAAFEDRDGYVFVQATGLQDMYRPFSTGPAVAYWARQIVYLRPNRFVVYDRTTSGGAGYDQYMAWHFPASPATGNAPSGENRLDVTYNGTYAGAMTTVLPAGTTLTTVSLYPTSNPAKVWQVQVRAPNTGTSQLWLTVFDMSTTASAVASATPITVSQGNMAGVRLSSTSENDVVLQSAAAAGTAVALPIAYTVPAAIAHHVITELAPSTGYNVSVSTSGGNQVVTVSQGGTFVSSASGVLDYYIDASGTVQLQSPVKLTAPISSLPVPGFPKPYKP